MTFSAVICDADDPCSVNAAYDPESSFTMSPRSTLPCRYFLEFSHSLSTAAFVSGIFVAWSTRINLCTKLFFSP